MAACSMPGNTMSPTYRPRPSRSRGSSFRRRRSPTNFTGQGSLSGQDQVGMQENVHGAHREAADDDGAQGEAHHGDPKGAGRADVEVSHQVPGLGSHQPDHRDATESGDERRTP